MRGRSTWPRPQDVHVFNAERKFLSHLVELHRRFPRLRIVLEHATTREAVETVRSHLKRG